MALAELMPFEGRHCSCRSQKRVASPFGAVMFDGWPILAFAHSILGCQESVMAFLIGYLDESGTHSASRVVSISGLVSDSIAWSRIEKPWKENLATTGVSWFHAVDCENGTHEFFGKQRALRESLLRGLSDAIFEAQPVLASASLIREDWDAVATDEFKQRFKDPYYFCFENCLTQISSWAMKYTPGYPVALVFAEQTKYEERNALLYRMYRNSPLCKGIGSYVSDQ